MTTPNTTAFGPPDRNMTLEDTVMSVRKVWEVDLDANQLVDYLYYTSDVTVGENEYYVGDSRERQITFGLYMDKSKEVVDAGDVGQRYLSIPLGHNQNGDGKYTWADTPHVVNLGEDPDNPIPVTVGTVWE